MCKVLVIKASVDDESTKIKKVNSNSLSACQNIVGLVFFSLLWSTINNTIMHMLFFFSCGI